MELGESATLSEIKKAYRRLSGEWHPDRCKEKEKKLCHEKMKQINRAYEVILKHIENYRYSFNEQEESGAESFWKKRFGGDPMWGRGWK